MTVSAAAACAAVSVAADLGVACDEPVVLADGANVIVHLSPSPVVAKVAASTPAVRADVAAWLQRELDVAVYLAWAGIPVLVPSGEVPATVHRGDGHVMSFWAYRRLDPNAWPGEAAQLDTCEKLRRLNLTIWYALYAERLPECRQRAAELLATWRPSA